jgi:flagellin
MAMVINTNTASINSQMYLSETNMKLQQSMQRLSSGLRINSAADDPSGLAISDGMTSQINGMTIAVRNANDGISMVQTADSAMASLTNTLQTMRELAVQASNFGAVGSSDRQKLATEFNQLGSELGRIIQNTQFNHKTILNGSMVGANFQVGANTATNNQISVTISNMMQASGIGSMANLTGTGAAGHISIGSNATSVMTRSTIAVIDNAIAKIDNFRGVLGAVQNRFTTTISNLQSSIENQSSARSRIQDTDFAVETSNMSRSQILQQAGTAMLAQANQSNQSVLSLLK